MLSYYSFYGALNERAAHMLEHHRDQAKALREEVAAIWLLQQQRALANGIRVLQIIALIAPLLGLLGTVIGLIQVFDTLGDHRGPIEPAMLAGGLGIAMKTTAAGLVIAVPALLGAHGFQLWVDRLIVRTEYGLNIGNLQIAGVCTEALK